MTSGDTNAVGLNNNSEHYRSNRAESDRKNHNLVISKIHTLVTPIPYRWCGQPCVFVFWMSCVFLCFLRVTPVCLPASVFIASSELRVCRSRCCLRSQWPSFAELTQLSWQPSGASSPLAAVSLSSPVSGLWPGGGGGGGLWVAFLALEVVNASPGRGVKIWGKRQTCLCLCQSHRACLHVCT